jgi:DNA-binding MarR family transcriptional regulator
MSAADPGLVGRFLGAASVFAGTVEHLLEEQLAGAANGAGDLTLPQLRLLGLLARQDGLRIGHVARYLCVSDTAASRAVDRLVHRGLVTRVESPADRRAVSVSVTPAARALLRRYEARVGGVVAGVDGALAAEGLERAVALLDEATLQLHRLLEAQAGPCFGCNLFLRPDCVLRRAGVHVCACQPLGSGLAESGVGAGALVLAGRA